MSDTTTPECRQHGPMTPNTGNPAPTWSCPDPTCYNTVLRPAEGVTPKGTIEITHTRADGTLLEGSRKGDGVWEIVRQHGFRSSRSIGLYIQQSRDKAAKRWHIGPAAAALRAAGWTVAVDIDEDERRSFAEAEEERVERAEDRAERFGQYAGNAAARSNAAWEQSRAIGRALQGEPIKIGHHSERRHRKDIERAHNLLGKSVKEQSKADYYANRAKASGSYEAFRKSPGVTLRRIAKLEADLRRVEKWQRGESAGGYTRALTPATVTELNRRQEELEEEIGYWRHVIAKAEEDGFKVWGPDDFKKGDFVLYGGTLYEVLRVNKKTLTIPHIHNGVGRKVVRKGDGDRLAAYTWPAPYDGVSGRVSAEEMAAAQSPAAPAAEAAGEAQEPAAAPVMHEDRALPLDR